MSNKNQEKKLYNNQDALKDLEQSIANIQQDYAKKEKELNDLRIMLIKAKGAQDILNQIEEGIEVDDTKSTD